MTAINAATIDHDAVLARYGAEVPRYTSYPTAPHFAADSAGSLAAELQGGLDPQMPASVYLHIPFCDRLCWFCGCHTKQTRRYDPVAAYVGSLVLEIAAFRRSLGFAPRLGALHLGGGSPSFLTGEDLARISEALHEAFDFVSGAEISVEIDPSDVTAETLAGLRQLEMTRASIGVQDFDPAVQAAINRPQSFEQTRDVIAELRSSGLVSVNVDVLYGLPLQTPERLDATVDQVIALQPERVALFGYAHVPHARKHQTMIREEDLPCRKARLADAERASSSFRLAGYEAIGIDHFARHGDPLAKAARSGGLHRNFQGYTADPHETLIGFGASAISSFPGGYIQNTVPTGLYRDQVDRGEVPAARGYRLTLDDRIRGAMIERLMCDFAIGFDDLTARFGLAAAPYVRDAQRLAASDTHGMTRISGRRFVIKPEARSLTRVVASWFDAHLFSAEARYSKAV
ncbi:oxygen-independent coproporphyrinogen III oxidase [Jiella endophytica]|uniref:Coproporphyrinogen-III oxidase n=1 Tax=Jiella endophytica TaxID=2558362 RepID=A0A4Y8RRL5_9HYPH|nr:oxygen-independent coproporphyrinogen III oxidase [Jiella endophytica]TFF20658.1 oxygen-independent coproporphyrinogen III oxidase [Jiella endophytica]TFF26959.1 oxygen-independent coproporphyrinogen III oxidase [Jiella endophytica]